MAEHPEIRFGELVRLALDRLPWLRPQYEQEQEWWGNKDLPQHVFYGDVLNPSLAEALEAGDDFRVDAVLGLVEDMAQSPDELVREVVLVTTLEFLVQNPRTDAPTPSPASGSATREVWERPSPNRGGVETRFNSLPLSMQSRTIWAYRSDCSLRVKAEVPTLGG